MHWYEDSADEGTAREGTDDEPMELEDDRTCGGTRYGMWMRARSQGHWREPTTHQIQTIV